MTMGRNIDGVRFAYFELTTGRVRCHQYVREIRDARVPRPFGDRAVAFGREMP
jgi:hypothetical protein